MAETCPVPAIVLSTREYGEADLLVTFLTPEVGPVTGIAKHARRSRRRFAHCLEPLSRVTFFFIPRGRDLEFLQKGELVQTFPALRRDLKLIGAAAVLAELAGQLSGPPEAHREIFATLETALTLLEEGSPVDSLLPVFLLHLLGLGGYRPRLDVCTVCGREPTPPICVSIPKGGVACGPCSAAAPGPKLSLSMGTWKLLRLAQDLPRAKLSRLRFPSLQRHQSLALLKTFIRYHLGRDLKSWSFLEKVAARARPADATAENNSDPH